MLKKERESDSYKRAYEQLDRQRCAELAAFFSIQFIHVTSLEFSFDQLLGGLTRLFFPLIRKKSSSRGRGGIFPFVRGQIFPYLTVSFDTTPCAVPSRNSRFLCRVFHSVSHISRPPISIIFILREMYIRYFFPSFLRCAFSVDR